MGDSGVADMDLDLDHYDYEDLKNLFQIQGALDEDALDVRARVARVCNQRATLPLGPRSASKSRPESRVRRRNLRTHARPRTLMALTPPQTSQEKRDQSSCDGALFYLRRWRFSLCVFRGTALVVDKAGAV